MSTQQSKKVKTAGETKPLGLTSEEVQERVDEGKVNGDQNIKTKTVGQIFRTNIFTFFNILFLVLAVLLFFFIPQNLNGYMQFGFLFLVLFNTTIGIVQELRAKKTMDKLSLISAPKVTAIRDGVKTDIAVCDIVLDDVLYLTTGGQICADAEIVEGSIEVNESQITGEPDAILKEVGDEIMSGSYVVSGKASSKVIRVGQDNFATKISAGAKYMKKSSSEILNSLEKIIKFMAIIIVPLGILLFCMKFLVHVDVEYEPLGTSNIFQLLTRIQNPRLSPIVIKTIGSLIGMIPSGLVALTSTVFAISIIRLSARNTLAQDLYCVETLARVDVLCLDKTGTITEGSMEVSKTIPESISQEEFNQILKNLTNSIDDDNSTALALKEYVKDLNADDRATKIIPFSSARKWSGATYGRTSYVMGAAEFIFKKLTKVQTATIKQYSEDGNRVLVLASTDKVISERALPAGMNFLGFILISDKIRAEAPDTLRFFREQGVALKIISGDNPITVKCVAKRAGMEDTENYIDLSTLTKDEEIIDAAERYTIFGRVKPEQKLLLVKALKANGHTVAMTGDGVNDVLALKESDCSVAMASGSDAAKNVSSLVLLDSNFASMPHIVAEGRRSINNLERSAALFLVKTIYNLLLALIFAIIPAQLPYEPNDMTIIGAVTIGIPSFLLALEPNNERITGRFITKVLTHALPGALTVVISVMGVVISSYIYSFSSTELNSMFYIMTAFASFLYLGKVCWRFNKVRIAIYTLMLALFTSIFFMHFPNLDIPRLFGMPQYISPQMLLAMALIGAFALSFFMNSVFLAQKFSGRSGFIDKFVTRIDIMQEKAAKREEKRLAKAELRKANDEENAKNFNIKKLAESVEKDEPLEKAIKKIKVKKKVKRETVEILDKKFVGKVDNGPTAKSANPIKEKAAPTLAKTPSVAKAQSQTAKPKTATSATAKPKTATTKASTVKSTTTATVAKPKTATSTAKTTTAKSANRTTAAKPTVAKTATTSTAAKKPATKPVAKTTVTKPTAAKPVAKATVAKPTATKAVAKATNSKA